MRFALIASAIAVSALASAQIPDGPKVEVKLDKGSAKVGSVIKGKAKVTFAPGLHGYQNPPSDEFQIPIKFTVNEAGFSLDKVTYPKGVSKTLAGTTGNVYEGTITIPFELKVTSKAATYNVNFKLEYQQCTESSCFPPSSVVAKAKLKVSAK